MSAQSEKAFDYAIERGYLSINRKAANYAGSYMFMRQEAFSLYFKHIDTRKYLEVPIKKS